jgi:predicted DNA-binding antitoxin AbrB/MazE fold protein
MSHQLKALYRGGVFVPQEPCNVPEGSEVELIIQGPLILPPEVKEDEERQHILGMVIERMQHNPLPVDAPRLTREALHERR